MKRRTSGGKIPAASIVRICKTTEAGSQHRIWEPAFSLDVTFVANCYLQRARWDGVNRPNV